MPTLRGSISLRLLIALVVIGPIVAAAIALVILATTTNRQIAEGLGQSIMDSSARRVQDEVRDYLAASVRLSDFYARRLAQDQLPATGELTRWERPMLDDLAMHPRVASICFANPAGDATWLLRHGPRLEVGRSVGALHNGAVEFVMAEDGQLAPTPIRTYTYEPRQRPWYLLAQSTDHPLWTPAYFWFGDGGDDAELGVGYTRTIPGPANSPRGVLVIDTTVGALSQFLHRLPIAESGSVFIVDDQQLLVAASHGGVTIQGKRASAADALHPAARAAAPLLAAAILPTEPMYRLTVDGEPVRARIVALTPFPGIRWKAAIILPERAFLADAQAAQRRALALAALALAGSLLLGYLLANAVTRPLVKLSQHVRNLGQGDFSARLELRAARELQQLSRDLNTMAADLQHHVELQQSLALATQVQQSLLPLTPPKIPGLDVFGATRYCDSTGGDYYDFIHVSELPSQRLLVAIGDVMGHGIAAALLMATARAALRASALNSGALGHLMNTVNSVLTRDNRHGRFMTMLLILVDPDATTLRWASAGHDPPLLYDPATDAFHEFEGGDVPLGVDESTQYEQYTAAALQPGQIVILGTDGIWEARNARDQLFGKEALCAVIRAHAAETSAQIAHALDQALDAHFAGTHSHDDITFVLIKVTPWIPTL